MTNIDISKIFEVERTCYHFADTQVDHTLLYEIYDLMKMGPTSANSCPLRIVFVESAAQKEKLSGCVMEGNKKNINAAPAIALFAYDTKFYEKMTKLYAHNPNMQAAFAGNASLAMDTATRNSTLQAAYFMVIARSKGLACAPMSGFDAEAINKAFFAETNHKINFICGLGYRAADETNPRLPRLDFDEACLIV